ncbi:hypothetical protein Tco_0672440 [Tanacetum coccineum]
MGNVKKSVAKRTRHQRHYNRRVNKRQMQMQDSKVDLDKALDASLVVTKRSGTESRKLNTSRLGNDTYAGYAYIRPVYDEEAMAKEQSTTECNIFATRQQHTEQPEFNNRGGVDQYTEKCQVKIHMLGSSLDNTTTDNKAKIKKEIDVLERINIELEHSVAKLLTENEHLIKEKEHLKYTYKDLYDSIKKTLVQTKDHNDSLIAQLNKKSIENADLKAQIQEKVFAISALKNKIKKVKRK